MSRREFNQCLAYMQIEPAEEGDNRRTASLMAQIANFSGRSLPDRKMMSPDDYLGIPEQSQTPDDQKAFMRGLKRKQDG